MKCSMFLHFLPLLQTHGYPTPQTFALPTTLLTFASLWAGDIGQVTRFLDQVESISPEDFVARATTALAFQLDEFQFKNSLDRSIGQDPLLRAANQTLIGDGTLDMVVDLLEELVQRGKEGIENVNKINEVRCTRILPAVDVYFNAVTASDASFRRLVAARAEGCFPGV
ncbi:hypothetical protein B0J11DRAFT_585952 [Dendryphion nanum]|uniref:Uncharacterized protein n=1 Tax=Dendryphion nanum TaxID=256645 RepID=A0A9P9D1R6_9PLEO|nr:hypothetical protein B0J11DRAFT_585952 [Dendryphion nanum]